MLNQFDFDATLHNLENRLKENFKPETGSWESGLSSSPLATAVAVVALSLYDAQTFADQIYKGINYLQISINKDGGWGDCEGNISNLSTTLLCKCSLQLADPLFIDPEIIAQFNQFLTQKIGEPNPTNIVKSILKHYGEDQTFSVPILTTCALAGLLGDENICWQKVPQLPFELAALLHWFFNKIGLPVVSYALPALIAIGLVRHKNRPSRFFFASFLRNRLTKKILRKLKKIQPLNGGFLEATPLTAFVAMSLVSAGFRESEIVKKGIGFILKSMRNDGSWPIDTNLSTWVTSLSINALSINNRLGDLFSENEIKKMNSFLINQQFTNIHPFTNAAPGGWGWTNLEGAVPDADDTSGVLISLKYFENHGFENKISAKLGIQWLMNLQNRDGGMPTFCKGWGTLPFDKSSPDISSHALRAFSVWSESFEPNFSAKIKKSIGKIYQYLLNNQQIDGSWFPLWFGNQAHQKHENPVYGTSVVLISLKSTHQSTYNQMIEKGKNYLISNQNNDGGWGGIKGAPSSSEETSLAIRALSGYANDDIIEKGFKFIFQKTQNGEKFEAAPIGLYFASLWYFETAYPLVFSFGALEETTKIQVQNKK